MYVFFGCVISIFQLQFYFFLYIYKLLHVCKIKQNIYKNIYIHKTYTNKNKAQKIDKK